MYHRRNQLHKEFDIDFADVTFKAHIEKQILDYQTTHILNFISIYKKSNVVCAIDFSGTGTGKTYTSIALCAQLGYEPIIICPKSVICYWKDICNLFNVSAKTIINYESIKRGKELDDDMTRKKSDIVIVDNDKFEWKNINKDKNIIIFDEAHRCKNYKSLNGKLLLSAKNKCRILLLSATIAQNNNDFAIFGYMLDFYKQLKNGKKWIESVIREDIFKLNKNEDTQLISYIYPKRGSRMAYADMVKKLTQNNISSQCYSLDDKYIKEIEKEYENLGRIAITNQGVARQKIEFLKIPIFIDLTEKYLDLGKSVVIFVNYLNTVGELLKYFNKRQVSFGYILGDQGIEERSKFIETFQENKIKLIICTITSGSESISLHDMDGEHPRVSLISPSFSGKDLCQALGRIYRTGVKSVVEQKIIFCDENTEKAICQKLKDKIKFMNNFIDLDKLDSSFFE